MGTAFSYRYQIYAHEITATEVGPSSSQVATLATGGCPADLTDEETIAPMDARALSVGRILPASTCARAFKVLGRDGVGELVFLIRDYGLIAIVLNAFDVPVPDADV